MAEAQAAPTIAVRVVLFADLRRFLPRGHDGVLALSLERGATVATLLAGVGIPADEQITIGLNGEQAQPESPLKDGDEIVLFSPLEGG